MVQLQILSKVLLSGDNSIIENNLLTEDYFLGYEPEYNFIQNHIKEYGNVPDKATFLAHFTDVNGNCSIELVEVAESDEYLVKTIREEYLYTKTVPIIQKAAELLKTDSNVAAEYLTNELKSLQPNYDLHATDIISQAHKRLEEYKDKKENQDQWFFTSGFQELDDLIHGIQRKEEFIVIFARTNQGKSWILEKMCSHVWGLGFNVGYISPEMGASSVGYRFDTLYKHYSNKDLMWGDDDIDEKEYGDYIAGLEDNEHCFMVSTPQDFDRKITVAKLKQYVTKYKLDLIAVDGITYMSDERYKRGDNKTTSLTNISEDLMQLSVDMEVPVLVVVQANRGEFDVAPELENIRDSDGIAHNASKVISIHQKDHGVLDMIIKKQRFGVVGGHLSYNWDINKGEFSWIPSYDDASDPEKRDKELRRIKKSYVDKADVF